MFASINETGCSKGPRKGEQNYLKKKKKVRERERN